MLKINEHHCQPVQFCLLLCDDTACKNGDCNKLKNILGLYFYKENVSEIIDLTRETFQYFFQSRIKPKHITSVAINIF